MSRTGFPFPVAPPTSTSHDDYSWRTGLEYEFLPDAMVYVTASRGYKGPGLAYQLDSTSTNLLNKGIVKPEIVHSYEVGFKTQWFDRRVTVNVAFYNEIFSDFQTTLIEPGTTISTFLNAGEMRTTGVDLSATWRLTPSFTLAANATYDNARYTDFKNAPCYTGQVAATGCVNSIQNLSGHSLADTPKTSTNLTARYEHPIGGHLAGYFQASDAYKSAVNFSSAGDPLNIQGGYSLVNLTAGINTVDGRWGVSVYGNNVLDKHYVDFFLDNGTNHAIFFNDIGYGALQTFGVAVNAHF